MKSSEYDKIDPTFLNAEIFAKKKCVDNGVDYYNYLGVFVRFTLFNYIKQKKLIKTIETLDFSNKISVRAILNKRDISAKEVELEEAENIFINKQKELFEWLNKTKEPYFFILNPIFHYGAGLSYGNYLSKIYGYSQVDYTGIQNLHIALDYCKYKIAELC